MQVRRTALGSSILMCSLVSHGVRYFQPCGCSGGTPTQKSNICLNGGTRDGSVEGNGHSHSLRVRPPDEGGDDSEWERSL